MKKQKLQQILDRLDTIHAELRKLDVPVGTLKAVNDACEQVELDLRQAAADEEN